MFVDTHGHASFAAFKRDSKEVLQRALNNNTWVVMPGTQYETSKKAVETAEQYQEGVYAAIGLHPIHLAEKRRVDEDELQSGMTPAPLEAGRVARREFPTGFETKAEEFSYEKYKALAQGLVRSPSSHIPSKVVAIGECGLDYYYEPKGKERRRAQRMKQKATLALQIKLAQELNLPLILHCRKAHEDLIEFLQPHKGKLRGVVHSYTGDIKQAERFYELGLYFGFNGLIFKDVPALPAPKEIIETAPLERILLETDSPYLIPPPAIVGSDPTLRNEPVFVKYVAEEIARIRGISLEEVASTTTANAKSLFGLP